MSRPSHEPTAKLRGMVEGYAACGTPQETIARIVGIDPKTLREHYREELDVSKPKALARVAANLFKIATNPEGGRETVAAACFIMKTQGGWKETDRRELVGDNGKPIQIEATALPDLSGLDQAGRDALRTVIASLAGGSEGDAEGA